MVIGDGVTPMDADESPALFECEHCGNLGIGQGSIRCCGAVMTSASRTETTAESSPVEAPTLADLLRTVFDMSDTELEICLCVMEEGDLTVSELADRIGYDRSVVSRHLNHLADLGVIDKQRRILERGGQTYVYTPVEPDTVRTQLRSAFVGWTRVGLEELATLEREKIESIADTDGDATWEIFREPGAD